ncbi:restriction endonuclease subunit S [Spirochaeta cellobiosiphila]|uniref:restriction endonuclease subunit S n=1 Tax=Spirochaeta cellobiosiphila TaxID=504483 RepID=UPI00040E6664|nr:restriction endonuclease subunit S [Spirochaeta cellobiosiphila]
MKDDERLNGWREVFFKDFASFRTGKLNSNASCKNGKFPFFTCSPSTLTINDYAFDEEALILAGNNANGKFALKYYKGKFNAYQRTYIISLSNEVEYKFIFYALKQKLENLEYISHGTATKYLTLPLLNTIVFTLPPLPEQKAIASVLSSLDDKIDLLHRQNETLEAMAETLFRQWFVEEADESWEVVELGDLIYTNLSSITKKDQITKIQYLDTSSIIEGSISELQLFDTESAPSRARRLVKHNDIVFSTVRPNQRHFGIIRNPDGNLVVSTGFVVIRGKDMEPYFIYLYLTSDDMIEYLHSIAEASTSTYPSLKPSDITNLKLSLPPESLLKTFNNHCHNLWNKIDKNNNHIHILEQLRNTLLPQLIEGKIKVLK